MSEPKKSILDNEAVATFVLFTAIVWYPLVWAIAIPINIFVWFRDREWEDGVGFWDAVWECKS